LNASAIVISSCGRYCCQSGIFSFAKGRSEPAIQTSSEFHLAARVRILSNNGSGGTPGLAIYDYDAARPFYDFAHYWYSLHFFTDRVDLGFTDRDADTGGLLASVPVPDFATVFHDVELVKIDGNDRTLKVYLDGQLVVTITGQSLSRTLDGVGFGYGLYVGTGVSEWDYVRYSTESAGCPPGPVSNLMVTADKNAITWNPMGHAVFDLAYARITAPHFDGDFSIFGDPGDAVCQSGCGHAALSYQIGCKGSPPPGGFDFWLVRAHACLPGTWNDGVNQTASRDPMDGVTPISGSVCP
jgi:hypothetical protein